MGCRDAMARSRGLIKMDFVPGGAIDFMAGGAIDFITGVALDLAFNDISLFGMMELGMTEAFGMAELFGMTDADEGTAVLTEDFGAIVFGAVAILARDFL
jgi:hypothetical protein